MVLAIYFVMTNNLSNAYRVFIIQVSREVNIYAVSGYPAAATANAQEVRVGRLRQGLYVVIPREHAAHVARLCCLTHAIVRHMQEDSSPPASDSHT